VPQLKVTKAGVYVETGGFEINVTQAGAYVEFAQTFIRVTQAGAYVEFAQVFVRVTQAGAYVEFDEDLSSPLDQDIDYNMIANAHVILPNEETGYQLDDNGTFWHIIVPEASDNLIMNPSFENGNFGYTFSGWHTTDVQSTRFFFGENAFALRPNQGGTGYLNYLLQGTDLALTSDLVTGQYYTWSIYLYNTEGRPFSLQVRDNLGAVLTQKEFIPERNGWARYWLTFKLGATAYQLTLKLVQTAPLSNTDNWLYTDGWQLERKAYPTTYFDGSFQSYQEDPNPYAYAWRGIAHGSRSTRAATTPNGGRLIPLSDWGFKTTGHQGLGLISVGVEKYGINPLDDLLKGFNPEPRTFILNGRVYGKDYKHLTDQRGAMIDALRPLLTGPALQRTLVYQPVGPTGIPYGKPISIGCTLTDGLSGAITNLYMETLSLTFQATDPRWYEDRWLYGVAYGAGIGSSTKLYERGIEGGYKFLADFSSLVDGAVNTVAYNHQGSLIAGGAFTTIGGVSANRVAIYHTGAWHEVGGGTNGTVLVSATSDNEDFPRVAIGGLFTTVGGGTTARRIARYDSVTDTLSEMATGLNDIPLAIVPGGYGDFYVGGEFTASGSGTTYNHVVRFDGFTATWAAMGAGLAGDVMALALSPDSRYLYAGGAFTTTADVSPITVYRIARFDFLTSTWAGVGGGFNSNVNALCFGADGMLYAGGSFTGDGTSSYNLRRFARWNGYTWEEVGGGVDNTIYTLARRGNELLVCGMFGRTLGIPNHVGRNVAIWTGHQWLRAEFDSKDTTHYVMDVATSKDGRMAFAFGDSDTEYTITAGVTRIYNRGSAEVSPIVVIPGGYEIYMIRNFTTGQTLYFRNFQTYREENAILDFRGVQGRFYSSQRADLTPFIDTTASNLNFSLAAGVNYIQVFGDNKLNPEASVQITIRYRPAHWSFDKASVVYDLPFDYFAGLV